MNVIEVNRQRDLYLVNDNRIIFIPKGWCDEFPHEEGSVYGWIGQESVNNWRDHSEKEWFTFDTQGWISIQDLECLREVSEAEARQIDPELFALLDHVNSCTN